MFVLSQSSSYLWPVTVEIPVSGGKFEKQNFDGEFKRLPQSRILEIQAGIQSGEISSDTALAKELLIGWKGILDKGEEVPFSEKNRDELLEVPLVAAAVFRAWMASLSGVKTKN